MKQAETFDIPQAREKRCNTCGEVKALEQFVKQSSLPDGYSNLCKLCRRKRDRAAYTTEKGRKSWLKMKFGLTPEDYLDLLASVDHKCQICGAGEGASKRNGKWTHLSIDHIHETGEIRGILCDSCNPGLGMFKDDPELLEKAAAYLRESGSEVVSTGDEGINVWQADWFSPVTKQTGKRWFTDVPEVAHKVYRYKRAALADAKLAISRRESVG